MAVVDVSVCLERDPLVLLEVPMKKYPPLRASAFPLIELLVVIGIIAILAALTFPAMGKVLDNANRVKCAANLKQLGAAMILYVNDNNGLFPLSAGVMA